MGTYFPDFFIEFNKVLSECHMLHISIFFVSTFEIINFYSMGILLLDCVVLSLSICFTSPIQQTIKLCKPVKRREIFHCTFEC